MANADDLQRSLDRLSDAMGLLVRSQTDYSKLKKAEPKATKPNEPKPLLERLSDSYTKAFVSVRGLTGSVSAGNVAGISKALSGLGNANGGAGAAGAISGAAVAAIAFKHAMDNATAATIEGYRKMADVSGSMAAIMANRDVREMLREQKRGEFLAPSAQQLTSAEQERKDASLRFEVMWSEIKSGFLIEYNQIMTESLKWLEKIYYALPGSKSKSNEDEFKTLSDMLNDSAARAKTNYDNHRENVRRGVERDW